METSIRINGIVRDDVLTALLESDTWEQLSTADPAVVKAQERLTLAEEPIVKGKTIKECDDLTAAIWVLVDAYVKAAFLYGCSVCNALIMNPLTMRENDRGEAAK